eukprot:CAMPEP_0172379108 /NCGR_PEP_ID=MMETSP1060-20121228/69763_1 /TAXON_ID=37318 /ORGANISM="Pseudo-nitzschia pungens, Strain cf. cingulata" /LENGTH=404 /DNA_ID=CAMNT_0013106843 /DNA_START=399 /DNA_END=1613 /DNA_ORIENTATION=+
MTEDTAMIDLGAEFNNLQIEADILERLVKLEAEFEEKQRAAELAIQHAKQCLEEAYAEEQETLEIKETGSNLSAISQLIAIADQEIAADKSVAEVVEEQEAREDASVSEEIDTELDGLQSGGPSNDEKTEEIPAIVSPPSIIRQTSVLASLEKQPSVDSDTTNNTVSIEEESCPEEAVAAVEEASEEHVEVPVEEDVEEPAEEPIEEPVVEPIAEPVVEPIAEPVESCPEEAVAAVEEASEEHVEVPVEEDVEEPAEEPIEEPVVEPIAEPVVEPIAEPVEEPIVKAVEEPAEEPVEEAAEEPDDATSKTSNSSKPVEKTDEAPTGADSIEAGPPSLTPALSTLSSKTGQPKCLEDTLLVLESKIEECRMVLMDPNSSLEEQTRSTTLMTQYAKSAKALMVIMV